MNYQKIFEELEKKWKDEIMVHSSTTKILENKHYLEIIGIGKPMLPYIFNRVNQGRNFWFKALREITGVNPVKEVPFSDPAIFKKALNDWSDWGESNGYSKSDTYNLFDGKLTKKDGETYE